MSNMQYVQHRLLSEQLEDLLHRDMDDLTEEEIIRVFCAAYVVQKQHIVDKHGRCRYCQDARWRWWRRKPCMVNQTFAVALTQPFNVVSAWLEDQ